MEGFDFTFLPEGEIVVDTESHDIRKSEDNDLRIQLAINRLKSISHDWFIDEIGANLEELVGRPCTSKNANLGKDKILLSLTEDGVWKENEVLIKAEIKDNTIIVYTIYLKIYQEETGDTYSYEIVTTLDLVKGVFVDFGWEPRR